MRKRNSLKLTFLEELFKFPHVTRHHTDNRLIAEECRWHVFDASRVGENVNPRISRESSSETPTWCKSVCGSSDAVLFLVSVAVLLYPTHLRMFISTLLPRLH